MTPSLIFFAIRGFLRLGQTAIHVTNQKSTDQDFLMPSVDWLQTRLRAEDIVGNEFTDEPLQSLIPGNAALTENWQHFQNDADPAQQKQATEFLYRFYLGYHQRSNAADSVRIDREIETTNKRNPEIDEVSGAIVISQWAEGKGPVSPYAKAVLVMVDIAFEYVAVNPSVLDLGRDGEKFAQSLAENFSTLLPDDPGNDAAYGDRQDFAKRLIGSFFRAGLDTATRHPDFLFGEAPLQALVKTSLEPVRTALPGTLNQDYKWHDVSDALSGPAINAALALIGQDPEAYLGGDFSKEKALGATISELLITASEKGLMDTFSKEGVIALYQSVARLAASNPALFLGNSTDKTAILTRSVFAKVADAIATSSSPFGAGFGLTIAISVIDGLHASVDQVFDQTDGWETFAGKATEQILSGLSAAFTDPASAPFSSDQIVKIANLFTAQLAKNPEMIAGDSKKLAVIVESVATSLKGIAPPFTKDSAIALAQTVVDGLTHSTTRIFDQTDPWEKSYGKVTGQILSGFNKGLGDGGGGPLKSAFSGQQFLAFGRVFAEQIAATPQMITGDEHRVEDLVRVVASAMAADSKLLLTATDWHKIIAVAAQQAARNPGRLFKIDAAGSSNQIATLLIKDFLSTASESLMTDAGKRHGVMFSHVLVEAISATLTRAAGNVEKAVQNQNAIKVLSKNVNDVVVQNPGKFGSKEWLRVFKYYLPKVLETGTIVGVSVEQMSNIVEGKAP